MATPSTTSPRAPATKTPSVAPSSSPASPSASRGGWTGATTPKVPYTTTASPSAPKPGTSYQLEYEKDDVTGVTERLAQQSATIVDMNNGTLVEMNSQLEKTKHLQEDVAQMHDDINESNRALNGIKSFGGWFSNIFKADNSQQHRKELAKNEKDTAKQEIKAANEKGDQEKAEFKKNFAEYSEQQRAYLKQQEGQKKSAPEAKKGDTAVGNSAAVSAGGFVFTERDVSGIGPQTAADRNLEIFHDNVTEMKSQAVAMGVAATKLQQRTDKLTEETVRAEDRIKAVNKKSDQVIKKAS